MVSAKLVDIAKIRHQEVPILCDYGYIVIYPTATVKLQMGPLTKENRVVVALTTRWTSSWGQMSEPQIPQTSHVQQGYVILTAESDLGSETWTVPNSCGEWQEDSKNLKGKEGEDETHEGSSLSTSTMPGGDTLSAQEEEDGIPPADSLEPQEEEKAERGTETDGDVRENAATGKTTCFGCGPCRFEAVTTQDPTLEKICELTG